MNKSDFIKEFAKNANLTQKDAREVTDAMFSTLFECMKNDEAGVTPITGVKFMTHHMEARNRRNPQTGEIVLVPAKDVPKVKFSNTIKAKFA